MSADDKKIQEKQLFAQRVTAASTAASAVATAAAAASLAQMRRDAKIAAEAAEEHRQRIEEIENAKAQDEARDREYHRKVLFLKESDDATKLDVYCEMAINNFMAGYRYENRKKALPEDCQEGGAITQKIKSLLASPPPPLLPEGAIELQKQVGTLENEINSTAHNLRKCQFGLLQKIGMAFCLLLVLAAIGSFVEDPNTHEPTPPIAKAYGILFLLVAAWLSTSLAFRYVRSNTKKPAVEKQLSLLKGQKNELETKLKPLLEEANAIAKNARVKSLVEHIEHWRFVAFGCLIRQFFDANLWIGSGIFAQELKNRIVAFQKDYPTSCRVDVGKLQQNQIASAYETFIKSAAILMCQMDIEKMLSKNRIKTGIMHHSGAVEKISDILRIGPSAQLSNKDLMEPIVSMPEMEAANFLIY